MPRWRHIDDPSVLCLPFCWTQWWIMRCCHQLCGEFLSKCSSIPHPAHTKTCKSDAGRIFSPALQHCGPVKNTEKMISCPVFKRRLCSNCFLKKHLTWALFGMTQCCISKFSFSHEVYSGCLLGCIHMLFLFFDHHACLQHRGTIWEQK